MREKSDGSIYFSLCHLEAQFLEEPLVLSTLVLFLQNLLQLLLGSLLCSSIGQGLQGAAFLCHRSIGQLKSVPCRHKVVVVDELQEGLHDGTAGDLTIGHGAGHFFGDALDADDQGVSERFALFSIIKMYL